ncbi:helix-turn-helix domain-containing protein [Paenibacillus cymbidii]|uniref:helix-turn-helix domain-containing protein n=1 Tax=Paenibacillus cymbidii TaxID=1639034 RepID=UPI001080A56C|nr:helix-turn-helix domain-containing protein [Paenibacillus cymbidii]
MPTFRPGRQRIVLRFLLSYLIVLFVPLGAGLYTYNNTAHLLEKEAADSSMSLLQQGMETLDRRLGEVDTITRQMMFDPKVRQIQQLRDPFQGTATYQLVDFRQSLYDYTLTNRFISGYYLLFKIGDLAMTAKDTYTLEQFYEHVFRYDGVSFDAWYDRFLNPYHLQHYMPAADATLNGAHGRYIAYVQTLGYRDQPQGAAVVLIDNERIRELLGKLNIAEGGWAYVADQEGHTISTVSAAPGELSAQALDLPGASGFLRRTIAGSDMSVTYLTSEQTGWRYVFVQPLQVVLQKVHYIKKTMQIYAGVSLLIGAMIAYWLAYRNSGPVRRMVSLIAERSSGATLRTANAYRFIQESLAGLYDRNEQLREEMERQRAFLREALFGRLLRGDIVSEREAQPLLEHAGIRLQEGTVVVALLRLAESSLDALDMQRLLVRETAEAMPAAAAFVHELSQDRIALLFVVPAADPDGIGSLERALERLRDELSGRYGIAADIAVGGGYERLTDAHRSLEEANLALHAHSRAGSDALIRYGDLPIPTSYYFPPDMQAKLLNAARAGEKEDTLRLLDDLYRINTEERKLSLYMLGLFVSELWGSAVKLADQAAAGDKGAALPAVKAPDLRLHAADDAERAYRSVRETYASVCEYAASAKKQRAGETADRVSAFMSAHYARAELNVSIAADYFRISDNYFPQWFKEQTGMTFTDCMLKLRMERAQQLLAESGLSIKEIAERVGYQSSNTFCRAFKRYHGVNATSYRDIAER